MHFPEVENIRGYYGFIPLSLKNVDGITPVQMTSRQHPRGSLLSWWNFRVLYVDLL